MKSKEIKDKAFTLYLKGISMEKIAKDVGVNKNSIRTWKLTNHWDKQRTEAREKSSKKIVEKYTDYSAKQKELSYKTIEEALMRLNGLEDKEFVNFFGKVMQVSEIRSQLNIIKQDNLNINIDLPKLIKATQDGVPYQ